MLNQLINKLKTLPPKEKSILKRLIEKFQNDPQSLLQLYAELEGYKEVPVDIITFIEHPKYLGLSLGGKIYPVWKEALKTIFPNPFYSPYYECIYTGAIGVGKCLGNQQLIEVYMNEEDIKKYGLEEFIIEESNE